MNCKQADNLLIDFLYGELSPQDRAAFELHLQGCPEHAREVEKLRGLLHLVRAQEPEEVPEALSARILQTARAQMPRKSKPAPFFYLIWNPAAAAAVLVVVVITVGLATHFMSRQAPGEDAAIEAARPLAVEEEPAERAVVAAKAEESKELAPVAEPEAPAAEPGVSRPSSKFAGAPPPAPAKKPVPGPKSTKRRKAPAATGARGGAGTPGSAPSLTAKADSAAEGSAGEIFEREKKAKDEKKVSRREEDSRFAKPPPPAKAAPAPPPREATMETAPVAMDREDDSYAQSRASRAEKKQTADYYRAAEADLANKRYDAAVSKYQTFLSRNPSDPRAPTCRYRIAKALFLAGRCAEAVRAISAAVDAAPRHPMAPGALLDQGSCYEKLNRLSEANATYRRINRDYPSYQEEAEKGMRRTRREVDVKPAATERH